MDLLYCADCRHAFTVPGSRAPQARTCPICAGALRVIAPDVVQVSPLREPDAGPAFVEGAESGPSTVALQRKHTGRVCDRVLEELARYFRVVATNREEAEVHIDRCPPSGAAWHVAAVLDGIDGDWEDHFTMPQLGPSTSETGA